MRRGRRRRGRGSGAPAPGCRTGRRRRAAGRGISAADGGGRCPCGRHPLRGPGRRPAPGEVPLLARESSDRLADGRGPSRRAGDKRGLAVGGRAAGLLPGHGGLGAACPVARAAAAGRHRAPRGDRRPNSAAGARWRLGRPPAGCCRGLAGIRRPGTPRVDVQPLGAGAGCAGRRRWRDARFGRGPPGAAPAPRTRTGPGTAPGARRGADRRGRLPRRRRRVAEAHRTAIRDAGGVGARPPGRLGWPSARRAGGRRRARFARRLRRGGADPSALPGCGRRPGRPGRRLPVGPDGAGRRRSQRVPTRRGAAGPRGQRRRAALPGHPRRACRGRGAFART